MRTKRFRIPLSSEDMLDVEITIDKGQVTGFVINLRCLIRDRWHPVYRVDTAHGYLHEQRFWISPTPIPLAHDTSLEYVVEVYLRRIKEHAEQYRKYYIQKIAEGGE